MLITPEILIDALILLTHDKENNPMALITELLALYDNTATNKSVSAVDDEIVQFYIKIIHTIMIDKANRPTKRDIKTILLKAKTHPTMERRRDLYDLLVDVLTDMEDMSAEKLLETRQRVEGVVTWSKLMDGSKSIFGSLSRFAGTVSSYDQRQEMQRIKDTLTTMSDVITHANTSGDENDVITRLGCVDRVNMSDKTSVKRALVRHKKRDVSGVIKTGLQGLNRMFGSHGGPVRGESIVFNALSHHYKSGMLTSFAMWAPLYNEFSVVNNKKPMVLMVSLENEAYQNMYWIFRHRYRQLTGLDPDELTDEQICDWICNLFSEKGITLEIQRYLPSSFGYDELVTLVEYYENQGYEILMCIIDYMNNMKKGSGGRQMDRNVGNYLLVKEVFNNVCNYTKTKNITLVTGHQLSRQAEDIASSGKTNVVRYFTPALLADAFDVQREVDVSIFLHIEKNLQDEKFLTMMIRKHRYVDDTPEKHKYCAYRFTPLGIIDDITTAPGYVSDIYATVGGEPVADDSIF